MSINTKKYIENYLKIRNKKSQIVPFLLNEPQQKYYDVIKKLYQEGKPIRIIILKARQMGFSTETEAILFKKTATRHNVSSGIIAHKEDSTTNLFEMSKLFYENLPKEMKPARKKSNAKELVFNNKDNTGLNSRIKCMTAGGKGIGRSDTFINLHLSELAFWEGDKKKTLIGLLQAVPNTPDSMVIIESTANGYEYFKELWDKAVAGENEFYPLFVGWNELKEYQMTYTGFALTDEEKYLQETYNLTLEQLTWRRWCINNNCGGDIEVFKQEYPICPEEAFLSTGKCYFDKSVIVKRIEEIRKKEPILQGSFICDYNGVSIKDIRFVSDKTLGEIKIYKKPENGRPYVLGGDTAGEGSDFFTAHVVDNITGEQVATLKMQCEEIEYVKQVYCLGKYYNIALIGLENNFGTYPTQKLAELKYPKLYIREKEDTSIDKYEMAYGFKTTSITRPLILAMLQEIVKNEIDKINDLDTLQEMLTFIKNKVGRPEAEQGYHDDLVLALAITYYIRTQQTMKIANTVQKEHQDMLKAFGFKNASKPISRDYGSKLKPI